MYRKVLLGSGLVALVPTVKAATPVKEAPNGPQKPPPMRPSDLPIYEKPHADYAEYVQEKAKEKKESYIKSVLTPPIRTVRETVQTGWEHTSFVTNSIQDNYHDFVDKTDWIVKYLREEENKEVRYGAVAMGGLTGFIFGLRGGIIRRLFYASIGTTAMGALCFPEQTKELANKNGQVAKEYINIAYNFLYGVKPGDPQLEVKFPELTIPKTFSEFVDLSTSMVSSMYKAVMPPPKEPTESKPSEKKN